MLEFYYDDSGTHRGSRVAVWGGIAGHTEYCNELEVAWKSQLTHPCDGKPPIKAFHSSLLSAGRGEFEGYSEAEKDLTRRNFRKIILDAGLTVLSFGVSISDWDEIVTGDARILMGDAERYAFAVAIRDSCRDAESDGQPLSFKFDRGRKSMALDSIVEHAIDAAGIDVNSVSYGYSPVLGNMGLQAADLVAHETYRFLTNYIDDPNAGPDPHLKRLFESARDAQVRWTGRKQIQKMADHVLPLIDQMNRSEDRPEE